MLQGDTSHTMAFYVISYGDIEPDLLVAKTRFTRVT